MIASDPYDVTGLLQALIEVRPDLGSVLLTSIDAHEAAEGLRPVLPESY